MVSQACEEVPVLSKTQCFPWDILDQMQRAWLPGRYTLPEPGSERQEDQLPAISKHFLIRVQAIMPQLWVHLQAVNFH
jgi:hypothetical protein